jgi:hypothetical protein
MNTRQQSNAAVVDYFEMFCNFRRCHFALGYAGPIEVTTDVA